MTAEPISDLAKNIQSEQDMKKWECLSMVRPTLESANKDKRVGSLFHMDETSSDYKIAPITTICTNKASVGSDTNSSREVVVPRKTTINKAQVFQEPICVTFILICITWYLERQTL